MSKTRQHEALRVPQGWSGQDKAFVIQLERILTDLYRLFGVLDETMVTAVGYDAVTHRLTVTIDGNAAGIAALAPLVDGKIPAELLPQATQQAQGAMAAGDKVKLDGIEAGAQVNPGNATQQASGLMSATDKGKLDGVEAGANAYTLPLAASGVRGGAQTGYETDGARRQYAVLLDGEKMYVHVPWEDTHQDISGKADRVDGAQSGNFAALDGNGNLMDSGHAHGDYLTEHQDISGKADKSETVSGVAYDNANQKITKTINGQTTDVVTVQKIKSDMGAFTWGQLAGVNTGG